MQVSGEMKKIFKDLFSNKSYQEKIDNNDFEGLIIDAYLKGGADAVKQMGKLFADAKLDMELYKNAVIKIGVELLQLSGQL